MDGEKHLATLTMSIGHFYIMNQHLGSEANIHFSPEKSK